MLSRLSAMPVTRSLPVVGCSTFQAPCSCMWRAPCLLVALLSSCVLEQVTGVVNS